MKVSLAGDQIERSEDFPFVPFTRYARVHVSCFSFFAFTPSPVGCKLQMLTALGVKVFAVLCSRSGSDFRETFSAFE